MSMQALEVPGGELVLRLEGSFDAPDAGSVRQARRAAGRGASVVLDFSRVEHYQDFAIALVATDLTAPDGLRIRLRGLGQHQRRLLEYFGVRGTGADESARTDAEPEARGGLAPGKGS